MEQNVVWQKILQKKSWAQQAGLSALITKFGIQGGAPSILDVITKTASSRYVHCTQHV